MTLPVLVYVTVAGSFLGLAFLFLSSRGWKKVASFPFPVEACALAPIPLLPAEAVAFRLGISSGIWGNLAVAICAVASVLVWTEWVFMMIKGSNWAYNHNFSNRAFRVLMVLFLPVGGFYVWLFGQA